MKKYNRYSTHIFLALVTASDPNVQEQGYDGNASSRGHRGTGRRRCQQTQCEPLRQLKIPLPSVVYKSTVNDIKINLGS